MNARLFIFAALLVQAELSPLVLAGGSGLNVAVVVNKASSNSIQLGNYYAERRGVSPQNLVRIHWTGGNVEWSRADFETHLFNPLTNALVNRGLTNQIDYVVLSPDIPYRVLSTNAAPEAGRNSTTSALFYGFKPDGPPPAPGFPASCSLPAASSNSYAGGEMPFRTVMPGNGWLTTMITASNLASAKMMVDQGVAADGSFPAQPALLSKSTDFGRNIRYRQFDDAVFNARVLGNSQLQRTNVNLFGLTGLLGFQSGAYNYSVAGASFVPGAMADNLTSFGGQIFEPGDQLKILSFLAVGASGCYGTIVEPCAWLQKFPSPRNYFYQARGFSLAECFYQSVTNPFQGLLLGEPLAAPFAQTAVANWLDLPDGAALSGLTHLSLQFNGASLSRPVQQVDLFLNGHYLQTITNIAPRQHNRLYVTLDDHTMSYAVPASASLASVATGLAAELNKSAHTNLTKVRARAIGDRVELQSFLPGRAGDQITLAVSNSPGSASALTTCAVPAQSHFLDTTAWGWRSFSVTNAVQDGSTLQLQITKTNGNALTLSVTNTPGNTNTSTLVQTLLDAVNAHPDLQMADGLLAEDIISYDTYSARPGGEFNLRARSAGWSEAQISVTLTASAPLAVSPAGTLQLDEQPADLMPRNHLYITAGVTNLPLAFALDTTTLADGFHELTAVAYEGSHVRTQTRVTRTVRLTNSPLAAMFTTLLGGSNTLVTATLQFAVTANTNTISRIELFSTGGWLAAVTNQATATFAVPGTNLHLGLHPFYAVVTRTDGKQYRTETRWMRLVGTDFPEPPFALTVTAPTPVLSWPATVARTYEILAASNVNESFAVRDALVVTNSPATWIETNGAAARQFYRVRTAP